MMINAWTRVVQVCPRRLRMGLVRSPLAPLIRRVLNRTQAPAERFVTVPLAKPLRGHHMRLDWQTQKGYVFGVYEIHVVDIMERTVRPGWAAVDVGAHLGYFTLLLAKLVGPSGQVVGFEPMPHNFRLLAQNVAMNRYENVQVENKAVAERMGRASMGRRDQDPLTSEAALMEEGPLMVDTVSLDDYFAPEQRVSFVKIDVEGAEALVLRGMRRILERYRPAIVMEVHTRAGREERFLSELGYDVRAIDPARAGTHLLAVGSPAAG